MFPTHLKEREFIPCMAPRAQIYNWKRLANPRTFELSAVKRIMRRLQSVTIRRSMKVMPGMRRISPGAEKILYRAYYIQHVASRLALGELGFRGNMIKREADEFTLRQFGYMQLGLGSIHKIEQSRQTLHRALGEKAPAFDARRHEIARALQKHSR